MTGTEIAIQVRGLSKEFANRSVLRQVDLDVAAGQTLGLTGANGAGHEGAGGKALTADGGASLDRYFAMLRERLRDNHEKPGGLSDLLSAEVTFTVAANGAITGVHITRSSGNEDFDQSVLEAFARVRSVGPRPDAKTDVKSLTFRMKEL